MKKRRSIFYVIKRAFLSFLDDGGMKLSAALSYYTVFSLGPLLIIVISLAGIVYGREAVQGKLYGQISGLVGSSVALQVQEIIKNIEHSPHKTISAIIGSVILFIGASGVFTEMQDSINYILSVKAKPQKGWLKYLTNRLLSFSLIIGLGFILLVSLFVSAFLDMVSDKLKYYFTDSTVYLFYALNILIIIVVISALFAVIFKILPDANIAWKDAFTGAGFTAVLFLGGKFLIGYYLGHSTIGVTYGAAASIIIIFLWVYFASIILYFGAEYTKVYAIERGSGITPKQTAVFIIKKESKEIPESYLDT